MKIKWFKNNSPLSPNNRVSIQYNPTIGVTALKILNPDPSDAGVYKVVAQNRVGNAETQTNVSLSRPVAHGEMEPLKNQYPLVKDAVREPQAKEMFEAPKFVVNLPAKCKISEGEPINLACEVDGKPKPSVTISNG